MKVYLSNQNTLIDHNLPQEANVLIPHCIPPYILHMNINKSSGQAVHHPSFAKSGVSPHLPSTNIRQDIYGTLLYPCSSINDFSIIPSVMKIPIDKESVSPDIDPAADVNSPYKEGFVETIYRTPWRQDLEILKF